MAVPDAVLLFAVGRADARIHVEHDASRRTPRMSAIDPLARETGKRRKVLFRSKPLRLEATHLARRRRCTRGPPCHRRSNASPDHAIRGRLGHDHGALAELTSELRHLNESLWDTEDGVRDCERRGEFGPEFIGLVRSVYKTNDRRSAVKRELDRIGGSAIVTEKLYSRY
jgi:hypothetical protein